MFFIDCINAKIDQAARGSHAKQCSSPTCNTVDAHNKVATSKNEDHDFKIVPAENTQRSSLNKGKLFPIDRVIVIIDGPERRHIICASELERVGIDGRRPTLNELIIEELIYQDAIKHKIPIDDYADRYIRSIKKAHNIGDREVVRIFEAAGLSLEEGRSKLQKMGANTTMVDLKVKARIFIAQHDVEAYFNQNPEFKEAKYQLEVAFVPFFSNDFRKQQEQFAYLMDQFEHGVLDVMWGSAFWLKQSDLAEDKKFITCMNVGDISKPQRVDGGFEMYRLKAKKEQALVPLQKRFREIVDKLREPKFKEMFDAYVKELFTTASIVYIDENFKPD